MSDRVKQILLDRIVNGIYQPGDRLVELQIARELNTSQAPVREALKELEALRVVESQAYRGTRVRQISAEELRESYQVRAALEMLAVQLAMPTLQADPAPLLAIVTAMRSALQVKNCDFEQLAKHDQAFHRLIVEASGNSVLLHLWESLALADWTRLNWVRLQRTAINIQDVVEEHQHIVDALIQGNGTLAGQRLQKHLTESVLAPELDRAIP